MNFLKQAASFAGGNKNEETSGASSGGFDVNNLSDMMSKAEGFLSEKKPEVADETPAVKEEEIVKKPAEDEQPPKPTSDEEVAEKAPTSTSEAAELVEPKKEETSEVAAVEPSEPPKTAPAPATAPVDDKPSYSELYGNAQTLYSGLQGKLGGKTDVDDKELAGAAENLVQGATELGLLKADSPYSDYFKKAEGFLHDYGSSASAPKKDESA